jgi:AraC-like DNA-binding protein
VSSFQYREFPAPQGWSHLIARVWALSGDTSEMRQEPIASDGCVELLFNFGDAFSQESGAGGGPQPLAALVGPTIRPTIVAPTGRIDILGIRLHPWSAGCFLRTVMKEVADTVIDLSAIIPGADHVLGSAGNELDLSARFEILTGWLAPLRARRPPDLARDIGSLLGEVRREIPSVGWLASATGRSPRSIERYFAAEVGIGAKALGRVIRMQRALALTQMNPRASWSRIALDAGFYDQPHFNREFRELVGVAPSEYGLAADSLTQTFIDPSMRQDQELQFARA